MNCEELVAALDAHHGAQTPRINAAIQGHIQACATCRAAYAVHVLLATQMTEIELPLPPASMEAAIAERIGARVKGQAAPMPARHTKPERWPWFSAALGAGIFVVADLGLFGAHAWQSDTLAAHLLPGLVSDRLLDLPHSLSLTGEGGVMALGIMLVVVALLRLANQNRRLYLE